MARWDKPDGTPETKEETHGSLFVTCLPIISFRAHSIVLKGQGDCCPLKEITFVYFFSTDQCRRDATPCYSDNSRRMPSRWSVNESMEKNLF